MANAFFRFLIHSRLSQFNISIKKLTTRLSNCHPVDKVTIIHHVLARHFAEFYFHTPRFIEQRIILVWNA